MKLDILRATVVILLSILLTTLLSACGREAEEGNSKSPSGSKGDSPVLSGAVFREVPKPLSGENPRYPLVKKEIPAIGESFRDLRFGTTITRITKGDSLIGRHEYSRFDPFNADQSMILLLPELEWKVYRTEKIPYDQDSNLVRTIRDIEEPRWDPDDPGLIWGLQDFSILKVNVSDGKKNVVKDFSEDPQLAPIIKAEPDIYRISTKEEGESSTDKRYWAFILQGTRGDYRPRYIFTWDREKDQVLGVYPIASVDRDIDWVGMSPKGNWVLIGGSHENRGELAGLVMADKQLKKFHRLDYTTSHADVGLDSKGNEVIIMQNYQTDYIDLIPIDLKTKPILMSGGSYEKTNRTRLVRLYYSSESPIGLNSGVHLSGNFSGYSVVSTYIEPNLQEQNWLDRTIILVKLDQDHPRIFYLAKVYNTTGTYWEETHATITNDGSQVVWASNWGKNVGEERVFLMQLDMPQNWLKSLQADQE